LHEALRERAAQLESLEERLGAFRTEYARRFGSTRSASPERYAFLRAQVREFPGSADLHFALYRQARELGDTAPAADHLRWAAEFAPDEPEYVGRYGYQLITSGHPDRAAEVARWFLQKHPREASVRVMLAQALASQAGGRTPDRAAALEVLQTVLTDPGADVNVRLAAVTLSGAIRRAAGDEAEAGRLLTQFDQLVTGLVVPMPRPRVAALREIFTGPATGEARDPLWAEPIRSELFRHEDELAATA
jgi:predicted Zn-dependent protease